jgi:hypothetical protein
MSKHQTEKNKSNGGVIHRVGPAPVSSGISFRALPEPTLLQVIKICQHHEAKAAAASASTSGSSSAASAAARYVYDLSREVQDVIRVLSVSEDAANARVMELESILREWNEVFSSPSRALQAAGITKSSNSPAAVARLVVHLSESLRAAETDATAQRVQLEREAADMRRALRDSGRLQREQAANELSRLKQEADDAIARERAARAIAEENLARVESLKDSEVERRTREGVEEETAYLHAEMERVNRAAQADIDRANASARAYSAAADEARADLDDFQRHAVADKKSAEEELSRLHDLLSEADIDRERAARASADTLQACEEAWRARLDENQLKWERSTGAARTASLEGQVSFLSSRTAELQKLCDAMQQALRLAVSARGGGGDKINTSIPSSFMARDVLNATQATVSSSASANLGRAARNFNIWEGANSNSSTSATNIMQAPSRAFQPPPAPSVASSLRTGKPRNLQTIATVRHASADAVSGSGEEGGGGVPTQTNYLSTRR